MHEWTERVPELRGHRVTIREVAASDVDTLFALFSDPTVTAYMAPPPPTVAKFAGFVSWAQAERQRGRGICFGIVPDDMAAAVGILQVRSLESTFFSAEWGFVLGAHFWSTGVFFDAANALLEFAFGAMRVERLEARIAMSNARAHAAVQKLGARAEATLATPSPDGYRREPQLLWTLNEEDWRSRTPAVRDARLSAPDAVKQIDDAVEAAKRALVPTESPKGIEPYPLFLFDRRRREEDPGPVSG